LYLKKINADSTGNYPKSTISNISYSLTKKRLKMMLRSYSSVRSGSKTLLLLSLLTLLTLTFCSKKSDHSNIIPIPSTTYSVPELHYDGNRSLELGIPLTLGVQYTSSGEQFTGTQRVYYKENDSLHMELYFEDGFNTGSLLTRDGDIYQQKRTVYMEIPHFEEININGILVYKDLHPGKSENGMGHIRLWHNNGQLALEAFYTGYTGNKVGQGIKTEYDEEGNITLQERYENGELVEKIK
jgi:hypothetical protein